MSVRKFVTKRYNIFISLCHPNWIHTFGDGISSLVMLSTITGFWELVVGHELSIFIFLRVGGYSASSDTCISHLLVRLYVLYTMTFLFLWLGMSCSGSSLLRVSTPDKGSKLVGLLFLLEQLRPFAVWCTLQMSTSFKTICTQLKTAPP